MTNLDLVSDEELARIYQSIVPPWWGLPHPLITEMIAEIEAQVVKRKLNLAYFNTLCERSKHT